ncbi:MAG: hypothetical protein ACU0DT_12935, partial [Albimonas sp.]
MVIFGFGLIAYWVLEEAAMAPGPDDGAEEQTPAAMPGGGGAPSVPAQDETLQPGDPEVEVGPRGEDPPDDCPPPPPCARRAGGRTATAQGPLPFPEPNDAPLRPARAGA